MPCCPRCGKIATDVFPVPKDKLGCGHTELCQHCFTSVVGRKAEVCPQCKEESSRLWRVPNKDFRVNYEVCAPCFIQATGRSPSLDDDPNNPANNPPTNDRPQPAETPPERQFTGPHAVPVAPPAEPTFRPCDNCGFSYPPAYLDEVGPGKRWCPKCRAEASKPTDRQDWQPAQFAWQPEPFNERQRKIFRYFDGTRHHTVDPMPVLLAMSRLGGEYDTHIKNVREYNRLKASGIELTEAELEDQSEKLARAGEYLARTCRALFNVPPYAETDGIPSGLTDTECVDLLYAFNSFRAELQRAARPTQSLPNSTEGRR